MTTTIRRRRRAALAAAALSGALALTACGSDKGDSDVETHTVTAANGEVEIPVDPQRVAALGNTGQPFIDLGGEPIAVTEYSRVDQLPEEQQATFKDATEFGYEALDLDELAGLNPDLILMQTDDADFEAVEDELNAIAPTVFYSLDTEWKDLADALSDAGNLTDGLSAQKTEYDENVAGIKEDYADLIASTSFVDVSRYEMSDPGTFVIADIGCSEIARDDIGLNLPKAAEGEDPLAYESLPFEQLSSLTEYDVITYPADADGEPTQVFAPVVETNTWQALPAVTSGNAVGVFCSGNNSYGQVNRYLDSLESALAKLPTQG